MPATERRQGHGLRREPQSVFEPMREILRSNDWVVMGFAQTVLQQAGIDSQLADQHISVMEGSIGAFPRRLLVRDKDWPAAYRALSGAGLGASLVDHGDTQV